MKKNVLLAVLAVVFFAACSTSIDSQLDSLEKAVKKGDMKKAEKICAALEKNDDITLGQEQRMFDILENADVDFDY